MYLLSPVQLSRPPTQPHCHPPTRAQWCGPGSGHPRPQWSGPHSQGWWGLRALQSPDQRMMPAGRGREKDLARFVYVTSFGSHQCGGVLELGGRQASGHRCPRLGARHRQEEPREEVMKPGVLGSGELHTGSRPKGPVAAASTQSLLRSSSTRSGTRPAARADLTQKDAAKAFDFPIQLPKACKIMRKRKKASVWNSVYKVISRMLEENEKYRLRLNAKDHLMKAQNIQDESSYHVLD
ncbi:uncharacterized protein C5orf47 homolog [Heterocephalus glaber]|uniref:Uncharacterized protein C5orf47 homolog n=1 Tax=Heterocephalus glaber TaxID=10181 RepID=A0AAX6NTW3_HETGA|nr:uncharacterized protein C5orf47 homolog [Heterocephalus glaber]